MTQHGAAREDLPEADAVPEFGALLGLEGRRFVVLGGGAGIGRQTVHALAQAGAEVLLVDRDAGCADRVAAEAGPRVAALTADVTDRAEMDRLAARAGAVDGLVDIVGIAGYGSLLDLTDDVWAWEHDIVLRHAWLAIQSFGPLVAERGGGSLAFVASVSGLTSAPLHGAYGAFKAALMSLVRTAAVELGPLGVRVNAVSPGTVWTPRIAARLGRDGHGRTASAAPLGRVAVPSEVASCLLFLLSGLSSAVTGQTLVVDCGATARFAYEMDGA